MRCSRFSVGESLAYQVLTKGVALKFRRNVAELDLRVDRIRGRLEPKHDVAAPDSRVEVARDAGHRYHACAMVNRQSRIAGHMDLVLQRDSGLGVSWQK